MGLENLAIAMRNVGVSAEQAASIIKNLSVYAPPLTEEKIERIKENPSLSFISKIRIIRQLKRQNPTQKD